MSNSTNSSLSMVEDASSLVQVFFVSPEIFNLLILVPTTYGFYQGIEIQHPLYAVLFFNLMISLANSIISIAGFVLLPFKYFVQHLNVMNILHLFFLCSNWCVTSVIRYIYILHENWLHTLIPSPKLRCYTAIGFSLAFALLQCAPIAAVVFPLGELYILTKPILVWINKNKYF